MNHGLNIACFRDTIPVKYNKKTILVNQNDQYISRTAIAGNTWEPHIKKLFEIFVEAGDTVLDCGANIGLHTLLLSDIVGPNGQVHSFEPCPAIFMQLSFNLVMNKMSNVTVYPIALGSKSGMCYMNRHHNSCEYFQKSNNMGVIILSEKADTNKIQIPVLEIDSLSVENIKLVKIDVESMEKEVIMGMKNTLKKCKPILVIEIHKNEQPEVFALLDSQDYEVLDIFGDYTKRHYSDFLAYPKDNRDIVINKIKNIFTKYQVVNWCPATGFFKHKA